MNRRRCPRLVYGYWLLVPICAVAAVCSGWISCRPATPHTPAQQALAEIWPNIPIARHWPPVVYNLLKSRKPCCSRRTNSHAKLGCFFQDGLQRFGFCHSGDQRAGRSASRKYAFTATSACANRRCRSGNGVYRQGIGRSKSQPRRMRTLPAPRIMSVWLISSALGAEEISLLRAYL